MSKVARRVGRAARRWGRRGARIAGWVSAGIAVLLVVDAITSTVYKTDEAAGFELSLPQSGRASRLLVVFPGYIMPASEVSKAFSPHLNPDDALLVVQYAERGVDIDQIYAAVMDRVRTVSPSRLVLYGASMGGMCAKQFLDRYHRDGDGFGKATLVLDTAPGEGADVRRPQWALAASSWYRGGLLTSGVWALISSFTGGPPAEPAVNQRLVEEARAHSAYVGMPAITTEAAYINAFPELQASELSTVTPRIIYLRGRPPELDPLIRVDEAIRHWKRAFPALQVIMIPGRSGDWHVPLIERPKETLSAFLLLV